MMNVWDALLFFRGSEPTRHLAFPGRIAAHNANEVLSNAFYSHYIYLAKLVEKFAVCQATEVD
jgi:hypothetical protein